MTLIGTGIDEATLASTAVGKRADMIVHGCEPYNAEPTPAALAASFVTPHDTFYSRNHGAVPSYEPGQWQLAIDGLVERPVRLGLAELSSRFDHVSVDATLQCAGNRRIDLLAVRDIPGEAAWGPTATSHATWTGVRLADVLAAAQVRPGAAHVCFEAPDLALDATPQQGYGSSIPLDKAQAPEVLLAWAMNGQPLEPVHGAPLRVVVPGYIGARSVKWLERMTLSAEPSSNFFQATAYRLLPPGTEPGVGVGVELGPVALNSAILEPADHATVAAGRTTVAGYAFAGGGRAVARVDVTADGGESWTQADLGLDRGRWAWRRWTAEIDVPPGRVEIAARAWDTSAAAQPEHAAPLWNPKGYVNNSWPRITVHADR